MNVSRRWFARLVLGAVAILGLCSAQACAQAVPVGVAPNPGIAPARALAGFANATTLGLGNPAFGVAGLGNGGLGALGYGGIAGNGLGYGLLAATYAGSGLGYGAMNSTYGNYLGLGYGGIGAYYSGQNTAGIYSGLSGGYQGYLTGAANITTANANYWKTIAQARLIRQEGIRSALHTRRAQIEEAEYERSRMPDPEKIRQAQLARELDYSRNSPHLTDIWSGNSLNTLLRHLIAQQGRGVKGPTVPISEDTLKSINPTAGDTRGNVGLLKDKGALQWPQPFQGEDFKEAREDFNRQMKVAAQTAEVGPPAEGTINDLQDDLKRLNATVEANVSRLSPDQYIEAKRYLRLLGDTVTALKDRNVRDLIGGLKGKSVAELVKFMAEKGLRFAPATPGDESAYLALYHKLAEFDAGMPPVASTTDSGAGNVNGYGNK